MKCVFITVGADRQINLIPEGEAEALALKAILEMSQPVDNTNPIHQRRKVTAEVYSGSVYLNVLGAYRIKEYSDDKGLMLVFRPEGEHGVGL